MTTCLVTQPFEDTHLRGRATLLLEGGWGSGAPGQGIGDGRHVGGVARLQEGGLPDALQQRRGRPTSGHPSPPLPAASQGGDSRPANWLVGNGASGSQAPNELRSLTLPFIHCNNLGKIAMVHI